MSRQKYEGAGSKSAQDKLCERCFGKKPSNETFIFYEGKTVCVRCSDAMRARHRKEHPRDVEYKEWYKKHVLKR